MSEAPPDKPPGEGGEDAGIGAAILGEKMAASAILDFVRSSLGEGVIRTPPLR